MGSCSRVRSLKNVVWHFKRRLDILIVPIDAYAISSTFCMTACSSTTDRGTRSAIEYLMRLAKGRIGLIGTNPVSPPSFCGARTSGELLQRAGGSRARSILWWIPSCHRLLAMTEAPPEARPRGDRGLAAADLVAIGALSAARDMGVQVPEQLPSLDSMTSDCRCRHASPDDDPRS